MQRAKTCYNLMLLVGVLVVLLGGRTPVTRAQTCVLPPEGLVSWWPGEGDAGDIIDENEGALRNGATFAPGLVGQAFSLDGVDDWVEVPSSSSLNFGTRDFTVELWVNFRHTDGDEQVLIEKWIQKFSEPSPGWFLSKPPENVIRFGANSGAGEIDLDVTPPTIEAGVWYFVTLTREGTTFTVYWNGIPLGTFSAERNLDSSTSLKLGHRCHPEDTPGCEDESGFYLAGLLDEVTIYNRALTAEEIAAIYTAGSAGKCRDSGAGQLVYVNDFEDPTDPLSEWSNTSTDTTPVGARRFLGQFDNHTVSLTLTDLPPHSSVTVSFDLFIIESWDGNLTEVGPDIWDVSVADGPTLLHTTFANVTEVPPPQAYPDMFPGGDHPPQTGAAEINTLGYTFFGDSVYQLSFTFPHAASSLVLNFSGSGLQGIGDESWGLDNVRVSVGPAETIVVTTAQESGPGSLRQALLDANANTEQASVIVFNIPTTDPGFDGQVFTIQPTVALPVIQRPILLDATTQTTFSGDSNTLGPEVVLNGSQLASANGLVISGDRTTIQGLIINGFAGGAGIAMTVDADQTPSQNQILNNYLGTDPTGALAVPNGQGVAIQGDASLDAPAQGNVIRNNVIAGNLGVGITLCNAAGTRITDNRIGTNQAEAADLGNGEHGIVLTCAVTRRTLIQQNTIAFNGGDGVRVEADDQVDGAVSPTGPQETTIRRNAIFANAGLGINLVPPPGEPDEGVTPNDSCDADIGGNGLQNFPELTVATFDGSRTRISGTLNSRPDQPFQLEFFANEAADPSGFGEGQRFIGETTVFTDGTCQARFSMDLPGEFEPLLLTATATDQTGNTSEFSPATEVIAIAISCQGGGQGIIAGQITTAEADQGLAGVTVAFFREEDGCQAQTMTDAAGDYQFSNLGDGTYIVTPQHVGCRFEPPGWRVGLFGGNAELPFTAHCSD